MLNWFRKDPIKKLENEYNRKMEQARDTQRKGDIVRASEINAEAEELLRQIDDLKNAQSSG